MARAKADTARGRELKTRSWKLSGSVYLADLDPATASQALVLAEGLLWLPKSSPKVMRDSALRHTKA